METLTAAELNVITSTDELICILKIHFTKLPKVQRFPCAKKDIKSTFANGELNWVGFAWPYKQFAFDSRCNDRPKISGVVIAKITVSRELETYACIYPILNDKYNDEAAHEFVKGILPKMRSWMQNQLSKPETQFLGYETMIVEWAEDKHVLHEIRYL